MGKEERRMKVYKEYIEKSFDNTEDLFEYLNSDEESQELIRCKDCEHHGTRTNMCDIWHRHTNGEGFCHRAKAVKKGD